VYRRTGMFTSPKLTDPLQIALRFPASATPKL
jgi:hypothetical protein